MAIVAVPFASPDMESISEAVSQPGALLLLSSLLASCWADVKPCNPQVHDNEKFEVTILALADPKFAARSHATSGLPPCALDDVHIGDKIAVTLEKAITVETGDECNLFECPLNLPAPAMRHDDAQLIAGSFSYVCISPTAKIELDDTCSVGRAVWLYSLDNRPLYTSSAADNPFILLRALTPQKSLLCPSLAARFPEAVPNQTIVCADQWVVELADQGNTSAR